MYSLSYPDVVGQSVWMSANEHMSRQESLVLFICDTQCLLERRKHRFLFEATADMRVVLEAERRSSD